jgi:chromosome segregation ATPase
MIKAPYDFLQGGEQMTNEEFQIVVLGELKGLNTKIDGIGTRLDSIETRMDNMEIRMDSMETRMDSMETRMDKMEANQDEMSKKLNTMETRQDEIYQVVTAIEHSNQVGRSELDSQNVRLSKVEGKLKKTARIYNDEVEIEIASNL